MENLRTDKGGFQFIRPIITAHDTEELDACLRNIPALDFQVSQETVEHVLSLAGKLMLGGHALPTNLREWWDGIDAPMKILVDVCSSATLTNSYCLTYGVVQQAVLARVALKWLECFIDES